MEQAEKERIAAEARAQRGSKRRLSTAEAEALIQIEEKTDPAILGRRGGRIGGRSRSILKAQAARRNGRLGGRPRKPRSVAS
jgi:hypothetical protein